MEGTQLLTGVREDAIRASFGGVERRSVEPVRGGAATGMSRRSFRRYCRCFEEDGLDGLIERRLEQVSHRRALVDEVLAVQERYRSRYEGWKVKHFHTWSRREGGSRSYSWIKSRLQDGGLVIRAPGRGQHRKRRDRAAYPGMMLHQDGGTHEWVSDCQWDLIVTMDDATNEYYLMFFVDQEGRASSLQGIKEVIHARGLFCILYTDRGSHYSNTPEAGGKVDKINLT